MSNPQLRSTTDLKSPLLSGGGEVVVDIHVDVDDSSHHPPPPLPLSSDPPALSVARLDVKDLFGDTEPSVPPPCLIDPFRNHTEEISGVYEWIKILLCLPIVVVRLVIFGLSLMIGFAVTKLALLGWDDDGNPMPRWRSRIMWGTRFCSRCILFSFGYQWINRKGRPVPRETAPIVVCNHVSYIEPIFFFYELFPTMVSSESHDTIPVVGTVIRSMQCIFVDRFSTSSRKYAVSEIKRKASSNQFPRVLLFPEGTTTNGRSIISFQLGAFIPGLPVQPVVIRYPYVHFDQSWGNISILKLMFRMFTQFHNFFEVEYLPIITPPSNKSENSTHFAEKTRFSISNALNVPQTSHSYADLMLFTKALKSLKGKPSHYMVEMAWVQKTYGISTLEAVGFLDKFLAMNPDSDGCVGVSDFIANSMLGSGSFAAKIFDFFDVEKKGSISFQQYLLGSAHILNQPKFQQNCESTYYAYNQKRNINPNLRAAVQQIPELFQLLHMDEDEAVIRVKFNEFMRKNPLLISLFVPHLNCDDTDAFHMS